MVDSLPGMPGEVPTIPCYRGDPIGRTLQFPDQDTTDWDCLAQLRRNPDAVLVLETWTVETVYQGDPELVRLSLLGDETALLPARILPWDLEVTGTISTVFQKRTMVKGDLDLDPDVSREEGS